MAVMILSCNLRLKLRVHKGELVTSQQTQNIRITFGPALYKCYANVLCWLGDQSRIYSNRMSLVWEWAGTMTWSGSKAINRFPPMIINYTTMCSKYNRYGNDSSLCQSKSPEGFIYGFRSKCASSCFYGENVSEIQIWNYLSITHI